MDILFYSIALCLFFALSILFIKGLENLKE